MNKTLRREANRLAFRTALKAWHAAKDTPLKHSRPRPNDFGMSEWEGDAVSKQEGIELDQDGIDQPF